MTGRRRRGNQEGTGSTTLEKARFCLGYRAVRGKELEVGYGAEIALAAFSVDTEQGEVDAVSGNVGPAVRGYI